MVALAAAGVLVLGGCVSGDSSELDDGVQDSSEPTVAQPTDTVESDGAGADDTPAETDYHERDVRGQSFGIDHEEAVSIALAEAGGGFAYQLEVDWSDDFDQWVYEVEVLDGNTDHEFDLAAADGTILKHERDDEDDSEREISFDMTPEQALTAAGEQLADGEWIEGWTLSWDDDRLEYEIDTAGGDDDIVIDVESGSVTRD